MVVDTHFVFPFFSPNFPQQYINANPFFFFVCGKPAREIFYVMCFVNFTSQIAYHFWWTSPFLCKFFDNLNTPCVDRGYSTSPSPSSEKKIDKIASHTGFIFFISFGLNAYINFEPDKENARNSAVENCDRSKNYIIGLCRGRRVCEKKISADLYIERMTCTENRFIRP